MSLYEVSGETVLIPGVDGCYTRRDFLGNFQVLMFCGGYCWTCNSFSPNPGCKKESDLKIPWEFIRPKYWNALLKMGLIE